jgi:hypothetical protein
MRRSSSIASTDRNTKFKLQNLDEKLEELAVNVHNTRMEAQVIRPIFRKPSIILDI